MFFFEFLRDIDFVMGVLWFWLVGFFVEGVEEVRLEFVLRVC